MRLQERAEKIDKNQLLSPGEKKIKKICCFCNKFVQKISIYPMKLFTQDLTMSKKQEAHDTYFKEIFSKKKERPGFPGRYSP